LRVGDTVKAVGLAALILALNLLATTLVLVVWMSAHGADEPSGIAAWSAPVGGSLLFLGALAWFGRRRPERNAWTFAVRAWLAYVILDAVSGVGMGETASSLISAQMALSMGLAFAGALAGAALARPATVPARL
jgi:hypothetical protein